MRSRRCDAEQPAWDAEEGTVDVGGGVRTKECDQCGDFLRRAGAAGRYQFTDFFRVERGIGQPSCDDAGRDGIRGDAP